MKLKSIALGFALALSFASAAAETPRSATQLAAE